jgi:hypothetical protein
MAGCAQPANWTKVAPESDSPKSHPPFSRRHNEKSTGGSRPEGEEKKGAASFCVWYGGGGSVLCVRVHVRDMSSEVDRVWCQGVQTIFFSASAHICHGLNGALPIPPGKEKGIPKHANKPHHSHQHHNSYFDLSELRDFVTIRKNPSSD